MEARFKKLYNYLNKNQELKQLIPNMTGDWGKDKDKFIKYQKDIEIIAKIID